jgi:hypothetical protein
MYGRRSWGWARAVGVPRREEGLLPPRLVRLDVTGGDAPTGRGVMCLFVVRLGAGDAENVAMLNVSQWPSSS